jgi:hypothetical protein
MGRVRADLRESGRVAGSCLLLAFGAGLLPVAAIAARSSDSLEVRAVAATASADDLGPTSDVPWLPSRPIPRRTGWESVVLLPGRIVSLPLVGLGHATERALLYGENSGRIPLGAFTGGSSVSPPHYGLSIKPPTLPDHSGFGAAAELREPVPLIGGRLKTYLDAKYAASLLDYNRTTLALTGRPALLEYIEDWRPQERFHGIGNQTSNDSLSDYASQSQTLRGSVSYGWNRDQEQSPPRTVIRAWAGTRDLVTRTGRGHGIVPFQTRFPALADPTLDRHVEHLIYGASFSSDWRTGAPHWSHGWRMLLSAERYDKPIRDLALAVGRAEGSQFTRYRIDAETGFSIMRDPRTLRFLSRVIHQDVNSDREHFLLSDLSTLGGRDGLSGFEAGRFHDLDLMLNRVSYVYPIARRLEIDLHSEWGAVYPDVWRDASLRTLRNSVGASLRVRYEHGPLAAVGIDFSREMWRIHYAIGSVE